MDLYTGFGSVETLLVPGYGILIRYSDLLQRAQSLDCPPNSAHIEILLLGSKSEREEWYNT